MGRYCNTIFSEHMFFVKVGGIYGKGKSENPVAKSMEVI